MHGCLDKFAV